MNTKKISLFKIVIGLFLFSFIIACNKDDSTDVLPEAQLREVVFDINNFIPQDASKNLFVSKDYGENDPLIPDCSDLEASYVIVKIGQTDYNLKLVTLNGKTETEVLKLTEGSYIINSFIVYAEDDTAIWASPFEESYYEKLWSLTGVKELPFEVKEFEKLKVNVDVLCYRPFDYEKFGFAWFAYSKIEIHTICFFGDICTKFYEEFHNDGPYFGQDSPGYDFPAIFEVVVKDEGGNTVNDLTLNSNLEWKGKGDPLCIEYPDAVGIDETFTFYIYLTLPNGDLELIHSEEFDDTAMSNDDNLEDDFGGTDGVFDFVVGNCSYDGNDASLELPAFIPLPETLDLTVRYPSVLNYIDLEISNVVGGQAFGELYNGLTIGAWCGDLFNNITIDQTYTADVYSSLDLGGMPVNYAAYGDVWNVLNWLINNHDLDALVTNNTYTSDNIQEGIWNLIHGLSNPDGGFMAFAGIDLTSGLTSVDSSITKFEPTVGDWAIVLLDPREAPGQTGIVQLMIVKVDP